MRGRRLETHEYRWAHLLGLATMCTSQQIAFFCGSVAVLLVALYVVLHVQSKHALHVWTELVLSYELALFY